VKNSAAVLIPVKSFATAKHRLHDVLSDEQRANLAKEMATTVLCAAAPLPVWVVCDDEEVAQWAKGEGASVAWSPGSGLNRAVGDGVKQLAAAGFAWVSVVHADLPNAEAFGDLQPFDGISVVSDRFQDGTNLIRLPSHIDFTFSYGPGSFHSHLDMARRLGLEVQILDRPDLALDVDHPDDLKGIRTQLWGPEGPHSW